MIDPALTISINLVLRNCINHPTTHCYLCGSFTTKAQRRTVTPEL